MKLSTKRILAGIMIAGDLFMVLVGLLLIFEEDMFLIGLIMLGLLTIDIALTIDYIRGLAHREKVENSLIHDNQYASEIRHRYNELSASERRKRPAQKKPQAQEEDLSDVLTGSSSQQNKTQHG